MGDISIIARRISETEVQYGWGGISGNCADLGAKLLEWYNRPYLVRYLFSLGEVRFLQWPLSEWLDDTRWKTTPIGISHKIGSSEQEIFSGMAIVDHGYFYDVDNTWYYVVPGPFRIKMPLTLVEENLDDEGREYAFLRELSRAVLREMAGRYYNDNKDFREYLLEQGYDAEGFRVLIAQLQMEADEDKQDVQYILYKKAMRIFNYFDDWIVVRATEDGIGIGEIVMRKKMEYRMETYMW